MDVENSESDTQLRQIVQRGAERRTPPLSVHEGSVPVRARRQPNPLVPPPHRSERGQRSGAENQERLNAQPTVSPRERRRRRLELPKASTGRVLIPNAEIHCAFSLEGTVTRRASRRTALHQSGRSVHKDLRQLALYASGPPLGTASAGVRCVQGCAMHSFLRTHVLSSPGRSKQTWWIGG